MLAIEKPHSTSKRYRRSNPNEQLDMDPVPSTSLDPAEPVGRPASLDGTGNRAPTSLADFVSNLIKRWDRKGANTEDWRKQETVVAKILRQTQKKAFEATNKKKNYLATFHISKYQ